MDHELPLDPFVLALLDRQSQEELGSNAFARKLGIDAAAWSLIARGKRRPGRKVILNALRIYPELAPVLISEDRPVPEPEAVA